MKLLTNIYKISAAIKNNIDKYFAIILTIFFIFGDLFFYDYFYELFGNNLDILIYIFVFELLILYVFIYVTLIKPIINLKKEIAMFLIGSKKGKQLDISGANPELKFILNFFNRSLEILKKFKNELKDGKILRSEVELASEIQKNTLNKKLVEIPSIDIVANTKSATEVGGDSYDVIKQENNYYIYLGDVTGHGVASGFVMMMVNALISAFSKLMVNGSHILANANEVLKPRVKSNMLMTLLMIRWNEQDKKLYMTGAGHEYLLVYKKKDNKTYKLKSGGVALGMAKDISKALKEVQISFEKGDIIIMYTDGITEARNSPKEDFVMFGIDRLVDVIEKSPVKTAQGVFNSITIELSKFMGYSNKQFDDITLVVSHYKGDDVVENNISSTISKENITEWNWV